MLGASPSVPPTRRLPRRESWWALGLIAIVTVVAYWGSLDAPFVFDDRRAILENPSIRAFHPWWAPLAPPSDAGGVIGRPLVNLSLAFNYSLGGTQPRGYHVLNLFVHVSAALLLYGVVRRTSEGIARAFLERAAGAKPEAHFIAARWIAVVAALLWATHPLQSESVTCIIQRTELLFSVFLLLCFYCFIRGINASSARTSIWFGAAVAACAAGMASKEAMAAAPLLVLLYDRAFVAGSFSESWRQRKWVYVGLAATWVLLGCLMMGSAHRAGAVGFATGISSWEYLLTQCRALILYLRLSLWPHPLIVDYGTTIVRRLSEVWLSASFVALLLFATAWASWRRPKLGMIGAAFFLILAPSSSFVPLATQTIAEHRMYLPLAAVLILIVIGIQSLGGTRAVMGLGLLAIPLAWATTQRNKVYASELALWTDTVAHRPENARAQINLGNVLESLGRMPEAIAHYTEATRLEPQSAPGYINLAHAHLLLGQAEQALAVGAVAVRVAPRAADAHVNLALALVAQNRVADAIPHYQEALRLEPDAPDVHAYLGAALLRLGNLPAAIAQLQSASRLVPDRVETWCDLARAYQQQRDLASARSAAGSALQLDPHFEPALFLAGNIEAAAENFSAAIDFYRRALAVAPDRLAIRNNLANALLMSGRVDDAMAEYRRVLNDRPNDRAAQENLARALELRR